MRPAIERAVQELVHPVVERSIKICLTTAEMIVKKVSDLVIVSYKPEFFQAFFFATAEVASITATMFFNVILPAAVRIYEFHIFITSSSSFHGFNTNQFNNLLPVGLLAQLVERCTGIAEVKGSNPVQT